MAGPDFLLEDKIMISMTIDYANITRAKWLKRAGIVSFWFFFIKGLLWLAAPLVFYFML